MEKILVTGGAGFIGSNFVKFCQNRFEITVIDKLTYCGLSENLIGLNHKFIRGDINDVDSFEDFDLIVHFAAETHVDNSLISSDEFIKTNVSGTWKLLETLRHDSGNKQFIMISTDEVYGDIPLGEKSGEDDAFNPSNPYSASKASADLLAGAYFRTYGLPIKIVRPSNCFGPKQFPEKLIPYFIKLVGEKKPMTLYGDGKQRRCWLYVNDLCSAINTIIDKGDFGKAYNVGGIEMENFDVAKIIQKNLGGEINFIDDRRGHDSRYCVDDSRLRDLGWTPTSLSFEILLCDVIHQLVNK